MVNRIWEREWRERIIRAATKRASMRRQDLGYSLNILSLARVTTGEGQVETFRYQVLKLPPDKRVSR